MKIIISESATAQDTCLCYYLCMVIYLTLINIAAFLLYGMDKSKARHRKWRIPEDTLIGIAAIGGCFGSYLGMQYFHHKTLHKKFTILVPLFCIIWIIIIVVVLTGGNHGN